MMKQEPATTLAPIWLRQSSLNHRAFRGNRRSRSDRRARMTALAGMHASACICQFHPRPNSREVWRSRDRWYAAAWPFLRIGTKPVQRGLCANDPPPGDPRALYAGPLSIFKPASGCTSSSTRAAESPRVRPTACGVAETVPASGNPDWFRTVAYHLSQMSSCLAIPIHVRPSHTHPERILHYAQSHQIARRATSGDPVELSTTPPARQARSLCSIAIATPSSSVLPSPIHIGDLSPRDIEE